MTDEQIRKQVESIREMTEKVLAGGPEACRKFLIDAGIIRNKRGGMNKVVGCKLRITRCLWRINNYIDNLNRAEVPFFQRGGHGWLRLKEEREDLKKLYDELDLLTGVKNERRMI